MKIKEYINKVTENWAIKAACVLLAFFIYVFYTLSIQDSKSFTVPLKIQSSGGIAPAQNYPSKVKVTLKGKTEDIASVRENEISAYVDLNYLAKDGTYKLPVLVKLPQNAMLLDTLEVKVSPEEINLKVEEQISGFVSINPLINGTPSYGYEIKSITLKPDTIEVVGPRSMVENCTRVQTKPISVKNAELSFEKIVDAERPGINLSFKENEKISVTVEIVPKKAEKKFTDLPVSFNFLPAEFEVFPKNLTASVEVSGNLLDLEKFTPPYGTVFVNCSSIEETGEYEFPLLYSLPEKFQLKTISKESVKFEVRKIIKTDVLEEKIVDEVPKISSSEVH